MPLGWMKALRRKTRRCVVFVVQWVETFEMTQPMVRALREAGIDARLVVTPERDIPHRKSDGSYNFELAAGVRRHVEQLGFVVEPGLPPEAEAERIRGLQPAAVFLPSPYVQHRHDSLSPSSLGLPVHYVNYGFNLWPTGEYGLQFELPFYRECSAIYAENEFCAEQFALHGVERSRIVKSGSPALDRWDVEHPRAAVPTVLWCPYWSTRWSDEKTAGYSTFLRSYPAVLREAAHRPHMRFLFRPHPCLWAELRSEGLWTPEEEREFHAEISRLPNVSLGIEISPTTRYPIYPSHLDQFEQAWAMVTDGVSFLAEFGYTGKPLLLTQAPNNPGWNSVGQAIADAVERSDGIEKLSGFLDRVERGLDSDAERRRGVIRRQFYRPRGGSAAAIARHIAGLAN